MITIRLTKGYETIIDDEDEWVTKIKCHASDNGHGIIYARTSNKYSRFLHRAIIKAPRGKQVDHINGNTLDNRRENLRIVTNQQNQFNKKMYRDNKTGFKGVWPQGKRFYGQIRLNGKKTILGSFETPLDAARAYNEAALKYFGEYARLNILP
ncbi:MAG: HNH endonuclease [Candidatus Limnocylindrales bacterium]